MAMGLALAKRGRPVRFLGKKEVFDAPIVGQLARAMGGIRVERGTGSDEPLAEAALALEAGELVAMMPEGTIPRGKAFFDPVLKGRWGAARLAAMTGAPVIPVGLWGTEKVWPRSERLPNVLALRNPPTVTIRIGTPGRGPHRRPRHRHQEDHEGDHRAAPRPRRARSARPPPRSWPRPTRAARSRTPTRRRGAPAPTDGQSLSRASGG